MAKKEIPAKIGRPEAPINWKEVESYLIAGCSGRSIASSMGFQPNTIYDRCLKDHGQTFTEYSQQFYEKGENLLRAHQFAKALGKTDKGDNTLLIWLGKVRLKQKEEVTMSESDHKAVASIVSQINKAQGIPDLPSSTEESTNP